VVFAVLKQHITKQTITQLNIFDRITTDPQIISCTAQQFYQELYSAEPVSSSSLLNNLPKLQFKNNLDINSLITRKEFKAAVKAMLNNKSPGLDGLGIEVYKTFSSLIKTLHLTFIHSNSSISSILNQD
jgi:hypothetical protein